LGVILPIPCKEFSLVLNLVYQVVEEVIGNFRIIRWKAPHVVNQTGHIVSMHSAKVAHGEPAVFASQIGVIICPFGHRSSKSFHDLDITWLRDLHLFPHMGEHLVKQENNRGPIGLGEVKCLHRYSKCLLQV
jgi:hypothetical protein